MPAKQCDQLDSNVAILALSYYCLKCSKVFAVLENGKEVEIDIYEHNDCDIEDASLCASCESSIPKELCE